MKMTDRDAVDLLEEMLKIGSLSGEENDLARFLVMWMRQVGMRAGIDVAGNAIGMVGEGPRTIVLLGHMDTVAGEIPVRIEDGNLYGRGAVDAKGPLAAFIAAAERLVHEPEPMQVIIVGCVEEEAPSSRGANFAVTQFKPDLCIVGEPSGWDGITLGYKGTLRATLRWEQPAAHSAHDSSTAAEHACKTWCGINYAATTFNENRSRAFDKLLATLVGITSGGDGLTDWAELQINLRLPPDLPPAEATAWLGRQSHDWLMDVLGETPAWSGPRTTPLYRALARAIKDNGGEARPLLKTGTADLNLVAPAWGCPALAYGPGDAALDHTPDEHISIAEYLRSINILENTLRRCASAKL